VTICGLDAAAREPSVVLLRPAHPTPLASEAIVRLRGELLAAGYAVETADVNEAGGVRAAIASASRSAGADAVVALFGDTPQSPGLLWVIDRASGKTFSRPIPHDAEGARSAQILSVRALELLRASLLEAALVPPPRAPAAKGSPAPAAALPAGPALAGGTALPRSSPAGDATGRAASGPAGPPREPAPRPPAPGEAEGRSVASRDPQPPATGPRETDTAASGPREAEAPAVAGTTAMVSAATVPPPAPARLAAEAGGLVLGSLDGLPPAVLPLFRLTVVPAVASPLLLRMTVAGLGTRARVSGAPGSADVSHQLAMAEAVWVFRPGRRWQPMVSLGAGAAHLSAQGFAPGGATGPTVSAWAFVADAGVGLHVALSDRLYLGGEVHAAGEAPYPAIRYQETQLASEGRPTWLAALSLLVWL